MTTRPLAGVIFAVAVTSPACSAPPMNVGQDPDILWWTDHETGDTSDWLQGGSDAGQIYVLSTSPFDSATLVVSPGVARSGRFAMRSTVTTGVVGPPVTTLAIRKGPSLPAEAYYSAWFYVPAASTPVNYWLCFKFRSRTTPADPNTVLELWDLDLYPVAGPNSPLFINLFHHAPSQPLRMAGAPAVPIGKWFQIEAFYRPAADPSGRLTVWQDGTIIYDVTGPTAPTSYVEWSVGEASDGLAPPGTASLYVDDAAISRRRLGPTFPVFFRSGN